MSLITAYIFRLSVSKCYCDILYHISLVISLHKSYSSDGVRLSESYL